jgi:hypothetical protein
VDELADSASLVDNPGGLRRRLADDGYLFFRGLLPASEVEAAGQTVLARPDQPVPAELIGGPQGRSPELFSRLFSRERWWEPVPAGLALFPRADLVGVPPGPSRLVTVHPGWKHWRPPPPAAVH